MSDKNKTIVDKLKTSPAAKQLREEGPMKVAKTLGGLAKDVAGEAADKFMDTLFPLDNTHQLTRQEHFKNSTELAVHVNDIPQATNIVHTYASRRQDAAPFREGNVSALTNAFEYRLRKSPPDGY